MSGPCNCGRCPAFRRECEGCIEPCRFCECDGQCTSCAVRCHRHEDLDGRLDAIGGLALDVPLRPQPAFDHSTAWGHGLPLFLPQLINGLEIPDLLGRERAFVVGIEKVLTPEGEVSRRAIAGKFGAHSLRVQWGIDEGQCLICIGNAQDDHLEKLWNAQATENIWGRIMALGFNAATSLNFSIYLDDPRLEHLVNIKRTWLTVRRMQETTAKEAVLRSSLIPIPHLQWATMLDLERQLEYVQAHRQGSGPSCVRAQGTPQGFHTLTLNLQMLKRQGWDTVAEGLAVVREQAPDLRFLFAGVAGLKRIAELARFFPDRSQVAFTNANAHYLAEHYIRLQRAGAGPVEGPLEDHPDLTRLIKEPVSGHPDRILLDNVRLYQGFLAEIYGPEPVKPRTESSKMRGHLDAMKEICIALTTRFGFPAAEADDWADRLSTDEEILHAFQDWLRTGHLDRDFGGSFPRWPKADCVPHSMLEPHLTMGKLLDGGKSPLEAFLNLADLAHRVYGEIEAQVGLAGY